MTIHITEAGDEVWTWGVLGLILLDPGSASDLMPFLSMLLFAFQSDLIVEASQASCVPGLKPVYYVLATEG
jgi:hypothetical protein